MRRSSSQDRSSFGPLRVKHDENPKASGPRNSRSSFCGNNRQMMSKGARSSSGSRMSVGTRSSSGSRMSVGGRPSIPTSRKSIQQNNRFGQQKRLSRSSGMGGRNVSAKDILPVSNKSYQQKCAANILQFLTDRGYPHHIAPKTLLSPTSKDFYKIFEFIYGFICSNYKVPSSRPEEEIPRIFKMVGYPITISRSSMFAIGSPHTWPTILAALAFLVEAITYGFSIMEHGDELEFADEEVSDEQLYSKYVEQAYTSYLEGSDTFEEEEAALKMALTNKQEGGSIDMILEDIQGLETKLELLNSDTDRLKKARDCLEIIQHDMERFTGYLSELDTLKRNLTKEIADDELECANLSEELETEKGAVLKMQLIYERQEFTQADVERITMKRRELIRQRDDVEQSCQTVDEEIWKKEIAMAKEMEQLESKCQEYNKLAYSLKLIPITAENSCGVDYEMKKPSMDDGGESWDFNSTIKPALYALKSKVAETTNAKMSEKLKLAEKLEQVTDYLSDVQNELGLLESKHKRAEDEFEGKKQLYQKEMAKAQSSVEQLHQEVVKLSSAFFCSDTDFSKEKKELALRTAREKERCEQKVQEYAMFIKDAMQIFMDHMEDVQALLSGLAERTEKYKTEAKQKLNLNM